MKKSLENGQILLIVVLIMVVSLTVGLSLASRSLVNLKIASDDENSQRAFAAAEASIERLVKTDCADSCTLEAEELGNGATVYGTIKAIDGASLLVKEGVEIKQDEGTDIWLSTYSTDPSQLYGSPRDGTVNLYWGDASNDCSVPAKVPAALDIMIFRKEGVAIKMDRHAVDPCATRRASNNFSVPNLPQKALLSKTFPQGYSFAVDDGLLVRVVPVYTNAIMGVEAANSLAFPTQGKLIEAFGEAGGTVRKVSFVQSYAQIPNEFVQYSMISR